MALAGATSWSAGLVELFDCLDRVGDASGAWRFTTGGGEGSILVERGRVCWAIAPGHGARLTEILCERHRLERAQVEHVYRRCRAEQVPIGQALVTAGLVAPAELAAALRDHTTEVLLVLANLGPARGDWIAHRAGGYQPQFTFARASLLAGVAALGCGVEVADAAARLAAILPPGTPGMAIVQKGAGPALPVVVEGFEAASARELLDAAAWASQVVRAAPDGGAARMCAALGEHGGVVAWRDDLICAAFLEHAAALPRLLARLSRRD